MEDTRPTNSTAVEALPQPARQEPAGPQSPAPQPAGPPAARRPFHRRHRWLFWTLGGVLGFLVAAGAVLAYLARHFEPYLRARIVAELADRFHTRVELNYFHIDVHHGQEAEWGLWAVGRGLRIWPPHRQHGNRPLETAVESTPLIDLGEFRFHVPLRWQLAQHVHIAEIRLKNLVIEVPPPPERDKSTGLNAALRKPSSGTGDQAGALGNVTIDRILCDGAEITMETDKPNRIPLEFRIAHLKLTHLFAGQPMQFEADLTNPKPKGPVHTTGSFGPLALGDVGESPVSGQYRLDHADMSTFKGLAGSLTSTGTYKGTLRDMTVDGATDMPNFSLTHFGNALPLHTKFHAEVNGTDGDTWLEPVEATLGQSHFVTSGKIVRVRVDASGKAVAAETPPGKPNAGRRTNEAPIATGPDEGPLHSGHLIELNVQIARGEMQDFLRLVSKSQAPLLTGEVSANANLRIPPGEDPLHLRIRLDGAFKLDNARFTNDKIQSKVEELSLRSQGKSGDVPKTEADAIRSQMGGSFHMQHGVISLPDLRYSVPGADILLKGTYGLDGPLDFDGVARMQATVSQMVGGWKGFLLKPFDGIFRKDGAGALIPIKIRGTRDNPDFGLDFGRIGHTSPERPGSRRIQ